MGRVTLTRRCDKALAFSRPPFTLSGWLAPYIIALVLLGVVFASPVFSLGAPQDETEENVPTEGTPLLPYRRVFVPASELTRIPDLLQRFQERSLDEVSKWVQGTELPLDQPNHATAPIEILASVYSARLVGPNLVSTNSLIRVSRGSLLSEQFSLEPWSLALTPRLTNPRSNNPPGPGDRGSLANDAEVGSDWAYDTNGTPLLNLHTRDASRSTQPKDFSFGWVLKGERVSNSILRFQARIPRSKNSCMLLLLPSFSQVLNSNAPVVPIQTGAEMDRRLSQLPPESRANLERLPMEAPNQTLWLFELGGMESLDFSISTTTSDGLSGSNATPFRNTFEHLLLDQVNEYWTEAPFLLGRGKFELQWNPSYASKSLQFPLSDLGKVRRFSVNGIDVDWSYDAGWLTVTGASISSIVPSNTDRVVLTLEVLFPISPSNLSTDDEISETKERRFSLPDLSLNRSFSLRGETTLHLSRSDAISYIAVQGGTYAENQVENQLSVQWRDAPASIQVALHKKELRPKARSITKLSGADGGITTWVRVIPLESIGVDWLVELEEGWEVLDVLDSDSRKTVPWEVISTPDAKRLQILLSNKDLREVSSHLDFLVQSIRHAGNGGFTIPGEGLLQISDYQLDSLIAAENLPSLYSIRESHPNSVVALETLSVEERSFLGNTERSTIWKLEKGKLRFDLRNRTDPRIVRLQSEVFEDSAQTLRVRHQIELDSANTNQSLRFEIGHTGNHWRSIFVPAMMKSRNPSMPLTQIEDDTTDRFAVETGGAPVHGIWGIENSFAWDGNHFELPVPTFDEEMRVVQSVILAPSLTIDQAGRNQGAWGIQNGGQVVWERNGNSEKLALSRFAEQGALPTKGEVANPSLLPVAAFDLALDSNDNASVDWLLTLKQPPKGSVVLSAEEDWEIDPDTVRVVSSTLPVWIEQPVDPNTVLLRSHEGKQVDGSWENETVIALSARRAGRQGDGTIPTPFGLKKTVNVPVLKVDGNEVRGHGNVWLPENSAWRSSQNVARSTGIYWDQRRGLRWWRNTLQLLFRRIDIDKKTTSDRLGTGASNLESADGAAWGVPSFPRSSWTLDTQIDKGNSSHAFVLYNLRLIQWGCVALFVGTLVITLLLRRLPSSFRTTFYFSLAAVLSLMLTFGNPWELVVSTILGGTAIGMTLGVLLTAFQRSSVKKKETRETTSTNWEGSNYGENIGGYRTAVKALFLAFTFAGSLPAQAQTPGGSRAAEPFDILVPTDESGEIVRDTLYVPNGMIAALEGTPRSNFLIYSARHHLSINYRNRPTTLPDQLVMTYDLWVGQTREPVRFPISRLQASLVRFSVEEMEIPTSSPLLQHQINALEWTPERIGRQTVQLVLTPSPPSGQDATFTPPQRADRWSTQNYQIGLLPSANAELTIESAEQAVQVDVDSRGGISNPSPGRFVVALGNVPTLRLQTRFPTAPSLGGTSPLSVTNFPTLDIEVLLQGSHVRAKSIILVPEGGVWGRTFVLEADEAWLPIGTRWGAISLVDIRSASSTARRQYVFEFDNEPQTTSPLEISILWGLKDPASTSLNVLFVECVDTRVPVRIFRYAGLPGSDWKIENVRTWESGANKDREQLDWPELRGGNSRNPYIASLRFPSNGGYGLLKRDTKLEGRRARVRTRWGVHGHRQTLNIRMETLGYSNQETIEFLLPPGFLVESVRHEAGEFSFFQDPSGGQNGSGENRVQLISERRFGSDHVISIVAKKDALPSELETPWLISPSLAIVEQNVELIANERWLVEIRPLSGIDRVLLGRGEVTSIASLGKGDQVRLTQRPSIDLGEIHWDLQRNSQTDRMELHLESNVTLPIGASSKFIIEYPSSLGTWRCDKPASQVSCPISDCSWIQVDLGGSPVSEQTVRWSFILSVNGEQLSSFLDQAERIRLLDAIDFRLPNLELANRFHELSRERTESGKPIAKSSEPDTVPLAFTLESQKMLHGSPMSFRKSFWFPGNDIPHQYIVSQKRLPEAVLVNGRRVKWSIDENLLTLTVPPVPVSYLVEISFVFAAPLPEEAKLAEEAKLTDDVQIADRIAPKIFEEEEGILAILDELDKFQVQGVVSPEEQPFLADWVLNAYRNIGFIQASAQLPIDESVASEVAESRFQQSLLWPGIDWGTLPVWERNRPLLPHSTPSEVRPKAAETILYAACTFLILVSIIASGMRWQNSPGWLLLAVAAPVWLITGYRPLLVLFVVLAALVFLDTLWLHHFAKGKGVRPL